MTGDPLSYITLAGHHYAVAVPVVNVNYWLCVAMSFIFFEIYTDNFFWGMLDNYV